MCELFEATKLKNVQSVTSLIWTSKSQNISPEDQSQLSLNCVLGR
jgi:hypothetical protein